MSQPALSLVAVAPPPARRRWATLVAVLAAIGFATFLLSFGLNRDPNYVRSVVEGGPAPDFTLQTLDGARTVRLADLRGQVVVVNFWASWCSGCKIEKPGLAAAWRRYRDQGVVVLGVSFQDGVDSAQAYAARYGIDWPLLADPSSKTGIAYGVFGIPETFFIAPDGMVAYRNVGPVSSEVLTERISQLLKERTP